MQNTDLSTVLDERHFGKWIALSPDYTEVVGYADTFGDLQSRMTKKDVVYMKAPQKDFVYAFPHASLERI